MAMISGRTLASAIPRRRSSSCGVHRLLRLSTMERLFRLRLQRFNRLGLCNPLGENQPSLSRRSELFAMPPVGYGLSHFAVAISRHSAEVNIFPFSHSRI